MAEKRGKRYVTNSNSIDVFILLSELYCTLKTSGAGGLLDTSIGVSSWRLEG